MDQAELESLAASIREHGVLQPILVTETLDGYQLVAGERRFRAAQLAGLERIPAVVRQLADREQLELALVENLQREPISTRSRRRTRSGSSIDEFALTQEQIAHAGRAGRVDRRQHAPPARPRSSGPGRRRGRPDHARATPGRSAACPPSTRHASLAPSSTRACRSARPRSSSGASASRAADAPASGPRAPLDPDLERVEEDLRRALGTRSRLARSRKGGRIVIEYYSDEELGRLYDRLTGGPA